MKDLLAQHHRKIAASTLALVTVLLLITGRGERAVGQSAPGSVSGLGARVAAAPQRGMWGGMAQVGSWLMRAGGPQVEELGHAQQELAKLREEKAQLIGILQENERLRALVGFKERHPEFTLVPARVIARDTTPYFRVLRITLSVPEGVKPRQPVVVAGGVVGQIDKVSGSTAEVVLISDPRSRIDAITQRGRVQGVVQGLGHERDYKATVSYLSLKEEVRPDDTMVTSGMGGVFPQELIIGTIREVAPDDRGLFQHVILEPAVDLSQLDEVFIITGTVTPAQGG
jgi:rod shape-determining protein MreC